MQLLGMMVRFLTLERSTAHSRQHESGVHDPVWILYDLA